MTEKYIVKYGMNEMYSNSRNVRKHIQDTGCDHVIITTKTGKFVCEGTRFYNGTISVTTKEN